MTNNGNEKINSEKMKIKSLFYKTINGLFVSQIISCCLLGLTA